MRMFLRLSYLVAFLLMSVSTLYAQDNTPIPVDAAVKIGKLENGLTYYLRQNSKPENRIELRLALKAGSINETADQKGLAHFVEHMCFNGTKTYKENELVSILESMGIRFGSDLNAYTAFEQTVYELQVPVDKPELIHHAFQILEDWAHQVAFEDKDIDGERGVITEEWRGRLGADERMRQQYWPVLMYNSKYAEHLPIGDMEIIRTFPYETLRKYYRDWYRPNLMAVCVVGDMPVEEMEKLVKKHFAPIQNPANAPEKEQYSMPDNKEPLIAVASDKEYTRNVINLYVKHPSKPIKTVQDYKEDIITSLYTMMFDERCNSLSLDPESPLFYAGASKFDFYANTDMFALVGVAKDGKVLPALEKLLELHQQALQHGFTDTELDRAKQSLLSVYEKHLAEDGKTNSSRLVVEYVDNFLKEAPIPGIAWEYKTVQELLPTITVDDVLKCAKKLYTEENRRLILQLADKEGSPIPSKDEVHKVLDASTKTQVAAYEDDVNDEPLLAKQPTPTRVVVRKDNVEFGYTFLKFANGAEMILKPTNFKNDEILFLSNSKGGISQYPDEDIMSASYATSVINMSGLGDFDVVVLNKKLSGKNVSISSQLSELYEGTRGNCSPKDLETLLQLNYLYFTAPRRDEKAFENLMMQVRMQAENRRNNPQQIFQDSIRRVISGLNPRRVYIPSEEQINRINLDDIMRIYKDRFAEAGDFKFTMVGNFEVDKVIPMLEMYIGGLPTLGRVENWINREKPFPTGKNRFDLTINSENMSQVGIYLQAENTKYSTKNALQVEMLQEILEIVLRESMREEQGGVYGVGVNSNMAQVPEERTRYGFGWNCSPDMVDQLINTVFAEIAKLKVNGPRESDIQKIKETAVRELETSIKTNSYWLYSLNDLQMLGEKLRTEESYKKELKAVTVKSLKKAANTYLTESKVAIGTLMPASKEE